MIELKPCPFCGGEAKICSAGFDSVLIKCSKCGIKQEWFDSEQEAIDAWNRRAE